MRSADRIDAAEDSDSGFTLVELLVAMFVMVIVLTIVMQAMTGWVVNTERRTSLSDQASDQIEEAFTTLDSEVRYAANINQPGSTTDGSSSDYWVEFESDWTSSPECTQLEYDTPLGVLQQRTWLLSQGTTPPSTVGWQVLASGLSTSITTSPFTLSTTSPTSLRSPSAPTTTTPSSGTQTTGTPPYQLGIALSSTLGKGTQSGSAQTSFTISAINVTATSITNQVVCGGTP